MTNFDNQYGWLEKGNSIPATDTIMIQAKPKHRIIIRRVWGNSAVNFGILFTVGGNPNNFISVKAGNQIDIPGLQFMCDENTPVRIDGAGSDLSGQIFVQYAYVATASNLIGETVR